LSLLFSHSATHALTHILSPYGEAVG
jgi:hypothetical protein